MISIGRYIHGVALFHDAKLTLTEVTYTPNLAVELDKYREECRKPTLNIKLKQHHIPIGDDVFLAFHTIETLGAGGGD